MMIPIETLAMLEQEMRDRLAAKDAEIERIKRICAELYQVLGSLADHAGVFDHPDVQRALDNASRARLEHKDLLPWPREPLERDANRNRH